MHFWIRIKGKQTKGSVMVETILILVVLIALVVIFKSQLISLVGTIFEKITNEATGILRRNHRIFKFGVRTVGVLGGQHDTECFHTHQ